MQDTPPKSSAGVFVAAVLAVAIGLIAATAVALYPTSPNWEARFNAEAANAVNVTLGDTPHKLAFSFDLAWQPSYTSLVCWGTKGDPRLIQPSWNTFREQMNQRKSARIGLTIRPWNSGETVVLLTVRRETSGPIAAQEDARETIELLRRHSPCTG